MFRNESVVKSLTGLLHFALQLCIVGIMVLRWSPKPQMGVRFLHGMQRTILEKALGKVYIYLIALPTKGLLPPLDFL